VAPCVDSEVDAASGVYGGVDTALPEDRQVVVAPCVDSEVRAAPGVYSEVEAVPFADSEPDAAPPPRNSDFFAALW
jgi:hypothetical protein